MYFDNLDLFLEAVKGEEKFINSHIKYNLPINYGIGQNMIVFSGYDGKEHAVSYKNRMLFETLDKIAVFTNNDLNCGCMFTMY